jgi:hypothetical protein
MNLSKKNRIGIIKAFFLAVLILWNLRTWLSQSYYEIGLLFFSIIFIFFHFYQLSKSRNINLKYSIIHVFLLGIFVYTFINLRANASLTGILNWLRHIVVLFFILLMNDNEMTFVIILVTKIFAGILAISLPFYFMYLFGVSLPYREISIGIRAEVYRNYYFFLKDSDIIPRFQSIFIEPGHLGMFASFLLYINRYKIKEREIFAIFVGAMFTLSLAAYVLIFLGFIIFRFEEKMGQILKLVGIIIIIMGCGYIFYALFPENIISKAIIFRLTLDKTNTRGFTGNNRTTWEFNEYYREYVITDPQNLLLGVGTEIFNKKFSLRNSSYKTFIFMNGLISLFLLIFFYLGLVYSRKSRLYFGLFLVYCISFWQRPYALNDYQLLLFIFAGATFNSKKYLIKYG